MREFKKPTIDRLMWLIIFIVLGLLFGIYFYAFFNNLSPLPS